MAVEEVKNDATGIISVLERKIIRQIEFYFGDVNFPKDKFLQEKIKEDDGWITIECLTTFNRLKNLTTDFEEIKRALKKSKSGLLEISEEEFKVRRSKDRPIPDADDPLVKKAKQMRTLYMKGFPLTYSFDEIQDFLAQHKTSTVYMKLRRDTKGKFKGSVFVEITTQEEADKLLNDKELKCEDTVMKVLRRDDYFSQKAEERKKRKAEKRNEQTENTQQMEHKELKWEPGMVLHFKNTTDTTRREEIKRYFNSYEPVSWIDFDRGDTQGFLRFSEGGGAQRAMDAAKLANDGKIAINENEVEVRLLEGDEEENFWKMAAEDDRKRENSRPQRRNQRGKFQKHKNRDFGKRKRPWEQKKDSTDLDKPQNEHKKFDSDGDEDDNNTETSKSEKQEVNEEIEAKKTKLETTK